MKELDEIAEKVAAAMGEIAPEVFAEALKARRSDLGKLGTITSSRSFETTDGEEVTISVKIGDAQD